MHCGGYAGFDEVSSDCFTLRVESSGEVVVDSLAALPEPRAYTCHGSDGGRLAVAGGSDGNEGAHQGVWLLDGVSNTWGSAALELPAGRYWMAGLLLGDLLVCMSGYDEEGC